MSSKKDEKNKEQNKKRNIKEEIKRKGDIYTEGITYIFCSKHNLRYPKGNSCPLCASGK